MVFKITSPQHAVFIMVFIGLTATISACDNNSAAEQALSIETKSESSIPEPHADIMKAFELTNSGKAEDYLTASKLLTQTGARPMHSDDDLASVWQGKALTLKPSLSENATPYRGRVKGPAYREHTIEPGETDIIREVFFAAEPAVISLDPRAAQASLKVMEIESKNPVCDTRQSSAKRSCEWLPVYTAPYNIAVKNESSAALTYLLISN